MRNGNLRSACPFHKRVRVGAGLHSGAVHVLPLGSVSGDQTAPAHPSATGGFLAADRVSSASRLEVHLHRRAVCANVMDLFIVGRTGKGRNDLRRRGPLRSRPPKTSTKFGYPETIRQWDALARAMV